MASTLLSFPAAEEAMVHSPEDDSSPRKASRRAPTPSRPGLRVIPGGGERRADEPLRSRDAVARVLMEAGVDLLLRRITPLRAQEIERRVDRILNLFDRADATPLAMPVLQRELDELEALMRETRQVRTVPRRRQGQG
jgi:hypothetical protein